MDTSKTLRRHRIKEQIEMQCLGFIENKIDRYLEIEHQEIIGDHYFAKASIECIYLYRDGYYIGTVMMSHAINEGIIKLLVERNNIQIQKNPDSKKTLEELIEELQNKKLISSKCATASKAIWGSYRADIHHMNSIIKKIDFPKVAQHNIKHLSTIEKEIFSFQTLGRKFTPDQPKYWDTNPDGTINVYLRLE